MSTPKTLPTFTLLLLISFGSISAVLFNRVYPPSLITFMQRRIRATIHNAVFNWLCPGAVNLWALANRYGRKPAIFVGVIAEIIAALLCAFSAPLHAFELLLAARFLMALVRVLVSL